jgi:TetR/AcrR family transcriptional regulator, repressor for neighboring sulfatase
VGAAGRVHNRAVAPPADPIPGADAPHGRDEIRAAVLAAATALFAERSPRAVSVREIAAAAGVQHSLVHRHFGSKDDLVREVLAAEGARIASRVEAADDPAEGIVAEFRQVMDNGVLLRAVARALLDGVRPGTFTQEHPAIRSLIELAAAASTDRPDRDPRVVVAFGVAAAAGWQILEEWLLLAADLGGRDTEDVRAEVAELLGELITGAPASPAATTDPGPGGS